MGGWFGLPREGKGGMAGMGYPGRRGNAFLWRTDATSLKHSLPMAGSTGFTLLGGQFWWQFRRLQWSVLPLASKTQSEDRFWAQFRRLQAVMSICNQKTCILH